MSPTPDHAESDRPTPSESPADTPPVGTALLDLIKVMDRLRSPGGCPWDAEQTHESLVEYLIEETYETVEAIEANDDIALREELGDLLLQVVFHSRIGEESAQPWNIDAVARGISDKLIRRHDHVFADAKVKDAVDSERAWQQQKSIEKGRTSVTDGVPLAMPSPVLAAKLIRRAKRGGVHLETTSQVRATQADDALSSVANQKDFGELLLALVAAGQERGLDADAALRGAVRDYRRRIIDFEG